MCLVFFLENLTRKVNIESIAQSNKKVMFFKFIFETPIIRLNMPLEKKNCFITVRVVHRGGPMWTNPPWINKLYSFQEFSAPPHEQNPVSAPV